MGAPKSWLCSILAAILLFGIAQAAPANPPEPQRSFASAEEAAKAFVAALRDNKKADLRAILGPEADRVVNSVTDMPIRNVISTSSLCTTRST